MSLHSRISSSVSPLLWLAPLPFALAMCLPVDLSRSTPAPAGYEPVAVADSGAQLEHGATSAAQLSH